MAIWKGVPAERNSEWRDIFNNCQDVLKISVCCPICNQKELYRFYHIEKKERKTISNISFIGSGSLWEWCRNCKHYEHMSVYVPEWWTCDIKLDESKLRHDPDYLNSLLE